MMTYLDEERWEDGAADLARILDRADGSLAVAALDSLVPGEVQAALERIGGVPVGRRRLVYAALGERADEIRGLIEGDGT